MISLICYSVWVKYNYLTLFVFRCLRPFYCCQVSPFVRTKSSPCCHVLGHHWVGEGSDMLRMELHYLWMEPVLSSDPLWCCSAPLWLHQGLPGASTGPQQESFHLLHLFLFSAQDRATFRRLIVKNNAKKRRMYESFIEYVPLLKSLEVSFAYLIKINVFCKMWLLPLTLIPICILATKQFLASWSTCVCVCRPLVVVSPKYFLSLMCFYQQWWTILKAVCHFDRW